MMSKVKHENLVKVSMHEINVFLLFENGVVVSIYYL